MASQTTAEILERQRANAALNTPLPGAIAREARDLSADGSASPLDERVIAAAAEALEAGETHYVDVPGIAPLRSALAEHLRATSGAHYESGNIIVTAGVQESRFLTLQKIGENHASVAVPAVAHPGLQKALGVRPREIVSLPVDEARGCLPSIDGIEAALQGGASLLYLESPSRLSGACYHADEVQSISQLLERHGASAIWDQGLAPFVAGGCPSLAAHDADRARLTCIGEAFPGMGLESWFIGYIAAPESEIAAMQSQKQIMAICTSTAAQYAALEASKLVGETRPARASRLKALRAEALERARALGIDALPGGAANIIALRASQANLRDAGYAAADGEHFGAPGLLRLNVDAATNEALQHLP